MALNVVVPWGAVGAVACVLFILWRMLSPGITMSIAQEGEKKIQGSPHHSKYTKMQKTASGIDEGDASVFLAENIIPLPDFRWEDEEPLKLRPFKSRYHLTMGLTNLPVSQLLQFDKTYLTRIKLRKEIIVNHYDIAIQATPCIAPAVEEFYTWLVGDYLPTRYPTLFAIESQHSSDEDENKEETRTKRQNFLRNLATGLTMPLHPPPHDVPKMLKILGENIDEDFLFMTKGEGEEEYRLRGYVTCFPSGFNTKEKFGMRLSEIHGPVPGYKRKLEGSMGRFFWEGWGWEGCGEWAITTNSDLFSPGGTHLYAGMKAEDDETTEIDINNTYLRTERQTLHRLPNTKALVFAFKTYLYPLTEVKEEGSGEALVEAIEGLESGSVPEMYFYKRGVVWGDGVKRFLRG